MARIYATSCEKDGKNFNDVPARLKPQVRAIIEADGYVIDDNGNVTKCERYTAPVPVVAPVEESEVSA